MGQLGQLGHRQRRETLTGVEFVLCPSEMPPDKGLMAIPLLCIHVCGRYLFEKISIESFSRG